MPVVMDRLTAAGPVLMGRVNVNTASAKVLTALGLDEGLAARVVDARAALDAGQKANPAWLFTQEVLDAGTFKSLAPRLTTRSRQFRVRCVGFGVPSGRFRVLEALIDTGRGQPRVVYQRDLTHLGMPFAPNLESAK